MINMCPQGGISSPGQAMTDTRTNGFPPSWTFAANAEAGPSCHRSMRSRSSSIRFSADEPSASCLSRPLHSTASATYLPYHAPMPVAPPPLIARKSDPAVIIGPLASPSLCDPPDPLDVTNGFEPLSPIIFHEPFGAGPCSQTGRHMAQRTGSLPPTTSIAQDHARWPGALPGEDPRSGGPAGLHGGTTGVMPMRNHAPWVRRSDAQPISTRAMSTTSSLAKQAVSPEILPDRQSSFFGSIDIPVERKEGEGRCGWLAELFIGATLCQCLPFFRYDPKY